MEERLFDEFSCVVVFLEPSLRRSFYDGFCRGYLSPIMHNQLQVPLATDPFKPHEWRAYCTANRIFASKVLEVYEDEATTLTWVHDY